MRHTATVILLIFCPGLIQAQDIDSFHSGKYHCFSLFTGVSRYIESDDAMSPFKYRGYCIPIELSYRYNSPECRGSFFANFDNTKLKSSLPDFENSGLKHYAQSTIIQMGYSYLRRVFTSAKYQSDLYFGCEINSLLNLRQHAYIDNNKFLMLDQFNSLGLKVQLEKRFANDKQAAFVSLNIPLISYVLMGDTYNAFVGKKIDPMMNYSGNMLLYLAAKGDFVSFNKLIYFKTDFSFVQFIGSHIGIECKYSIRFYNFTQFQDINYSKNLQNQFLFGIIGNL